MTPNQANAGAMVSDRALISGIALVLGSTLASDNTVSLESSAPSSTRLRGQSTIGASIALKRC